MTTRSASFSASLPASLSHATPPVSRGLAESEILEARLALRVTAVLNTGARQLPHDLTERLRVARETAIERARSTRSSTPLAQMAGASAATAGRGMLRLPRNPWWVRLGAILPLVVLVSGLVMIQRWQVNAQITDAADIDAALLTDDLPPSAYADPGFVEFLKTSSN